MLANKEIKVTRVGVWKFIEIYDKTGSVEGRQGSGRPSIITEDIKRIVDEAKFCASCLVVL